jgi:hypothetical protein
MTSLLKIAASLALLASLSACTVVPAQVGYEGPAVGVVVRPTPYYVAPTPYYGPPSYYYRGYGGYGGYGYGPGYRYRHW